MMFQSFQNVRCFYIPGPGANVINLFFFIHQKKLECLSLMFASKASSLPIMWITLSRSSRVGSPSLQILDSVLQKGANGKHSSLVCPATSDKEKKRFIPLLPLGDNGSRKRLRNHSNWGRPPKRPRI